MSRCPSPAAVAQAVRRSRTGKHTRSALYAHRRALRSLAPELRAMEACSRPFVAGRLGNVVKWAADGRRVSFLQYRGFDQAPLPRLELAVTVEPRAGRVRQARYGRRGRAPVLHRKRALLEP